jgi:hypothetical protein
MTDDTLTPEQIASIRKQAELTDSPQARRVLLEAVEIAERNSTLAKSYKSQSENGRPDARAELVAEKKRQEEFLRMTPEEKFQFRRERFKAGREKMSELSQSLVNRTKSKH